MIKWEIIRLRNTEEMYLGVQRRLPGRDKFLVKMRSEAKTLRKNITGIQMNMHEEDIGKARSFMGWKSMKCLYYSNTWHDTLAKVEMLGDGKRKKFGTRCKKKKKKNRKEQRFESYSRD